MKALTQTIEKLNQAHTLSIRSLELGEYLQHVDLLETDARFSVNEAVSALLERQVSLLAELCELIGEVKKANDEAGA